MNAIILGRWERQIHRALNKGVGPYKDFKASTLHKALSVLKDIRSRHISRAFGKLENITLTLFPQDMINVLQGIVNKYYAK